MLEALLQDKLNYWVAIILVSLGLWAMIVKNNLLKKLVGMVIFQSAIIMFFVSMAVKEGATIPIIDHHVLHPEASQHAEHEAAIKGDTSPALADLHTAKDNDKNAPLGEINAQHAEKHSLDIRPEDYANPLPHVLMLTAIVVGVATLGVALSLVLQIFTHFNSLEEPKIAMQIRREAETEGGEQS